MITKEKINLFLVDDDPTYLKMLEHSLRDSQYYDGNIKGFCTGHECLSNMSGKPDIVVLDYLLNSSDKNAMNGIETLKKIKKTNPKTQVIMLSGQDKIDVAINSLKFGAFDYVVKNENAFIRTQNSINNMVENVKLRKIAWQTRVLATVVVGVILTVVIAAFVYNKLHPGFL